jgi:hypothetical protein
MARTIEKKLSEAGYKLLGESEIEDLILSILEKKDNRFLKAIPYLIYLHNPDLDIINAKIKNKKLFGEIISITKKIFEEEGIERKLPPINKKTKLNFQEFKQEFDLQKRSSDKPTLFLEKEKIYAERNLQMWLSQLFTKKEKYIIQRILAEKPISKTDYEYYSRKTKKKLNAIINLKDFATSTLPLSPKIDQELFELKKLLEKLAEKEGHKYCLLNRFITTGDNISLFFSKGSGQKYFTLLKNKFQIKNQRLNELISKYKEHNFEN